MSESPDDLAVAFRSFGRRLDEALAPLEADPALAAAVGDAPRELARQLQAVLAEAAGEVDGVTPTSDVRATGAAIASAIESIPADAWDGRRLERLRALALEAGRVLRQIEDLVASARH